MDITQVTRADTEPSADGIAKITSWEEYWVCLAEYTRLARDPKSLMAVRDEYMLKVKLWMLKDIEEMGKRARKGTEEERKEIRNFVERFDSEVAAEHFYGTHGADLFPTFFRYYVFDHPDINLDYDVGITEDTRDHFDDCHCINTRVDNILLRIIEFCDKQDLLMVLPELMFKKKRHTQKMAKLLILVAKLYQAVPDKQAKYIQGSLFVLGAFLKMEARSFLKAKGKDELIQEDLRRD
jgi:hypothetical protein